MQMKIRFQPLEMVAGPARISPEDPTWTTLLSADIRSGSQSLSLSLSPKFTPPLNLQALGIHSSCRFFNMFLLAF